jgi:peroxiredoxin
MRIKLFLFFLPIITIAGCKNNRVLISGKLSNPVVGEYILLDQLQSDKLVTIDSALLLGDGTFNFKLEIKTPSFYLLKKNENNFLTMLLEPGQSVKIEAHLDSLNYPSSVKGSKGTELMAVYNRNLRKSINKLLGLNAIYMQKQGSPDLPSVIQSLDSMAQVFMKEINSYTKKYIDENLTSLVSLVALYQQVAPSAYVMNPANDLNYFIKVDSSLSLLYPDYEPVKSLHQQVQGFKAQNQPFKSITPASGERAEAPEISLPSPKGDTIKLSSTRGSVVLLDFWASWCSPCRLENPNLIKAYNLYQSKGFQIYQVSLDKTKEAWTKGIQDDHLERWIHVSDIKYWNSIVVPLYKIESIPSNFLLDREGRIIASNLRGEMLESKLAEIFSK